MTSISRYSAFFLGQPPRVVAKKVGRKMWRTSRNAFLRWRDRQKSTYAAFPASRAYMEIERYFRLPDMSLADPAQLCALTTHYLAHRFDLLGSGWTEVRHGMTCRGLEGHRYDSGATVAPDTRGEWLSSRINPANLRTAKAIWQMVDPSYRPIDWHLDFKSGYRWREDIWFKDIAFGHLPGVDIKVPWELARMHHLPHLALAHALAVQGHNGFASAACYSREFRNQILDFISTNPPRYGVNWACTMDVAIRTVNWLVAYDLFRASGAEFDAPFTQILTQSIYEHGQHVAANLEWMDGVRGNHYLADIAGLLFSAAYLPRSPKTDAWLAFAVQELVGEVDAQFHDDGSNFEASTVYHRLSSEIVAYATALVMALPADKQSALQAYDHRNFRCRPRLGPAPIPLYLLPDQNRTSPFPDRYWHRLERMAEFTIDITRPDGKVIQIGDNDSGRLLKIHPSYRVLTVAEARHRFDNLDSYYSLPDNADYLFEDHLDHRHLVAAVNGFFDREDFVQYTKGWEFETQIVKSLTGGGAIRQAGHESGRHAASGRFNITNSRTDVSSEVQSQRYCFSVRSNGNLSRLRDGLQCCSYPDFGLYIYNNSRLYLAIRCGPTGLNGLGPHAHNDPLSIELWLDHEPIIVDPGTYLYTPLPDRRNQFRSVTAHFSPHFKDIEPGRLDRDIFFLEDEAKAECLNFEKGRFLGCYTTNIGKVYRNIQIGCRSIIIHDWTNSKNFFLKKLFVENLSYSHGYGWITHANKYEE